MVSNARYYEPSNNEESLDSITELSPTDSIVNTFADVQTECDSYSFLLLLRTSNKTAEYMI